jgi:hypothetical protein
VELLDDKILEASFAVDVGNSGNLDTFEAVPKRQKR